MKKTKITARDLMMLVVLILILIGAGYYLLFYTPLQNDLKAIDAQCVQTDADIQTAVNKRVEMEKMQAELDIILQRPKIELTEIAPYDNKEVVLNMLYSILGRATTYSLSFEDPTINADGTVRRNVSVSFSCKDYDSAHVIIQRLNQCKWRCMVNNLSVTGDENIRLSPVSVNMTFTFFESTKLNPEFDS